MKQDLQKKIEDVMNSFDGVQRAEANHFLYGKIRNRMMRATEVLPAKLGVRIALSLSIVIAMNVITIKHLSSVDGISKNGGKLVATEYAISIPETY